MDWQGRRESDNVEDRRGYDGGGGGGGGRGLAIGGGVSILGVIVALLLGVDPRVLLQQSGQPTQVSYPQQQQQQTQTRGSQDQLKHFVSVVLADTEDDWREQFRKMGKTYRDPHLVLFSGRVRSACGLASEAVGPFYCTGDEQVYIDLSFYE